MLPDTKVCAQNHSEPRQLSLPPLPEDKAREGELPLWADLGGTVLFQKIFAIEAQLHALEAASCSEALEEAAPWLQHYCAHLRKMAATLTDDVTVLLLDNGISATE